VEAPIPRTASSRRIATPGGIHAAGAVVSAGRKSWRAETLPLQRKLAKIAGAPPTRRVRLRYCSDTEPGIRRIRHGRSFRYVDAQGRPVRDAETLIRIRSLAIPPAYADVWICTTEDGHVQATARDARGRKQYRYHPSWRERRDVDKFDRMAAFGRALPAMRARVDRDMGGKRVSRRRVLATLVHLLERTLVRVGNEEYARENGSFGLTTLRDDHVDIRTRSVRFVFRGKAGVEHDLRIVDRKLAAIVRRCRDIPGQELFRYEDGTGRSHPLGSGDVNQYIRDLAGESFSAKDFRTWAGSVLALAALSQRPHGSAAHAKREIAAAIAQVAQRLGNTSAVCRKSYVHPLILSAYLERGPAAFPPVSKERALPGLEPDEARLLRFLERGTQTMTLRKVSSQSRAKRSIPNRASA